MHEGLNFAAKSPVLLAWLSSISIFATSWVASECSPPAENAVSTIEDALTITDDAAQMDKFRKAADEWYRFTKRFTAKTPLAAHLKTWQWKPDLEPLEKVLKIAQAPETQRDQIVKLRSRVGDPMLEGTTADALRDQAILESLERLVKTRDDDELLIIFVGAAHAYDLSLLVPEMPIAYVSSPFNAQSQLSTQALAENLINSARPLANGAQPSTPASQAKSVELISQAAHQAHFG